MIISCLMSMILICYDDCVKWDNHPEFSGSRVNGLGDTVIRQRHTVDGRNPAPVDRWFIPLFIGFQ